MVGGRKRKRKETSFGGGFSSRNDVLKWWVDFQEKSPSPLYCVFLAYSSDLEVVESILEYGDELEILSGDDCCMIFFRDLEKAKLLQPFTYKEHVKSIPIIAQAAGVRYDEFPGLLFFNDFNDGDFVFYKLGGKSTSDIIRDLREIFQDLSAIDDPRKKLKALRKLQNSHRIISGQKRVLFTLSELGKKMVATIIDEVIKKNI